MHRYILQLNNSNTPLRCGLLALYMLPRKERMHYNVHCFIVIHIMEFIEQSITNICELIVMSRVTSIYKKK